MLLKNRKANLILNSVISNIVLISFSLLVAIPFLWMVTTSVKTIAEVWIFPPKWIADKLMWQNYPNVFTSAPMVRYIFNTLFVATSVVIIQQFFIISAAYSFSVLKYKGRDALFFIIIATLMVPYQMTFLPVYLMLAKLGWIDTFYALIVPFFTSAFGIFLVRQAFKTIPKDLIDAARIDGAGHISRIRNVMIPNAYPTLVTFALFSFIYHYNDYFWPMIVTNTKSVRTIALGLARFVGAEGGSTDWPLIMAGNTVAILPLLIVFLLTQKYLIQGFATSGLKG